MRHSIQVCTCLMIAILISCSSISTYDHVAKNQPTKAQLVFPLSSNSSYITHDPISIGIDHDFAYQGFSGSGTKSDPYVIEGLNITAGSANCISIRNTRAHFVIRNCYFANLRQGHRCIRLSNIGNGTIKNCLIEGGDDGVYLDNSNNCTISNCSIVGAIYQGIKARETNGIVIVGNKIFGCGGILGGTWTSTGISMAWSYNCTVKRNLIYQNDAGVSLGAYAINNTLTQNLIGWNREYNAFDDGTGNLWNVSEGNSWSDYDGTGLYEIDGDANSSDSQPTLLTDTIRPNITSPQDIDYEEGETGNNIAWQPRDEFSHQFIIRKNDNHYDSGLWNGLNISINVDGLTMDEHNFTLTVFDAAGNNVSDSVIVSVYVVLLGGIGTELVMIASGISVLIVVAMLLLVKKLR